MKLQFKTNWIPNTENKKKTDANNISLKAKGNEFPERNVSLAKSNSNILYDCVKNIKMKKSNRIHKGTTIYFAAYAVYYNVNICSEVYDRGINRRYISGNVPGLFKGLSSGDKGPLFAAATEKEGKR